MTFLPKLPKTKVILKDKPSQHMLQILLASLIGMYEEAENARIDSHEWITYKFIIANSIKTIEERKKAKSQPH